MHTWWNMMCMMSFLVLFKTGYWNLGNIHACRTGYHDCDGKTCLKLGPHLIFLGSMHTPKIYSTTPTHPCFCRQWGKNYNCKIMIFSIALTLFVTVCCWSIRRADTYSNVKEWSTNTNISPPALWATYLVIIQTSSLVCNYIVIEFSFVSLAININSLPEYGELSGLWGGLVFVPE